MWKRQDAPNRLSLTESQRYALSKLRGQKKSSNGAKSHHLIAHDWLSEASLSIFLALLVIACFMVPSMGLAREDEQGYFDIAFSVRWITGILIAWRDRVFFYLACVVAFPTLIVNLVALWRPASKLMLWRQGLILASILVILLVLLRKVFGAGLVTRVRIQCAIAVYLLFGLGWAHAYDIVAVLDPGSFAGIGAGTASRGRLGLL